MSHGNLEGEIILFVFYAHLNVLFQSSEGIGVKFVGDADENDPDAAADAFEAIEDLDDSQSLEGDEGDEEIEHFTVENSYLEEKHSALTSIIRMAQKIPQHIAPQRYASRWYKNEKLPKSGNFRRTALELIDIIQLGHMMASQKGQLLNPKIVSDLF